MMTNRQKCLVLPICGLVAVSLVSGCVDTDAQQRSEGHAKLESASTNFRNAEFSRVVSDLTPMTGGDAGQQAARGLLLAEAQRELGLAQLVEAERMELELQRQRNVVHRDLANLVRFEEVADSLGTVTAEPERVALQQRRDEADRQIRDLSRRISELEGPIRDMRSRIEQEAQEVERLRLEADELLHEAINRGHADGLQHFKQSVALRRQADQADKRASLVEIEVSQDHEANRRYAQLQLEHAQALLESVRATLRDLEEFDRLYSDQVAGLRGKSSELRQKIQNDVNTITTAISGELDPRFEQAVSQFERAASQAAQAAAAGRGEASAARMTEARGREALGRAMWTKARGLADHVALLEALVQAGPALGNTSGYQSQLQAARARYQEAIAGAKAAFDGALNAVNQVSSRDASGAFRHSLQNARDLLEGKEVDLTPLAQQIETQPAAPEAPAAPEGATQPTGTQALLAELDQITFDTVEQTLAEWGMTDPSILSIAREAFETAKQALRARIERGEITDAQQLEEAINQEVMKALGLG